jgi:hypothetical protein
VNPEAIGEKPRTLAAVCGWLGREKGRAGGEPGRLRPFSLTGIDAVPPPESSDRLQTTRGVLKDHNALIWQHKSFPPTTKNRLADPSEICALDFARQFPRFRICQVSATIGINRSIFVRRHNDAASAHAAGKYR